LDTKQARILEAFTIWNLLGFVAGFGLGSALAEVSGVGVLTPLCCIVGVVLTMRRRNMLIAFRLWVYTGFLFRRWTHQDRVTNMGARTTPTQHAPPLCWSGS
jgi:hypothetical protein